MIILFMKKNISFWIIACLLLIGVIALVGKMAYDQGKADGYLSNYNDYTTCVDRCDVKPGNEVRFNRSCLDNCILKGKGNYYYEYPPFPL